MHAQPFLPAAAPAALTPHSLSRTLSPTTPACRARPEGAALSRDASAPYIPRRRAYALPPPPPRHACRHGARAQCRCCAPLLFCGARTCRAAKRSRLKVFSVMPSPPDILRRNICRHIAARATYRHSRRRTPLPLNERDGWIMREIRWMLLRHGYDMLNMPRDGSYVEVLPSSPPFLFCRWTGERHAPCENYWQIFASSRRRCRRERKLFVLLRAATEEMMFTPPGDA